MKLNQLLLLISGLLALGCSSSTPPTPAPAASNADVPPATTTKATPSEASARVTSRPPNLDGVVFVVEYHRIAPKEARWDRSISRFRSDLERLYKMGFRPVTLTEYISDKMPLSPGASPVVFTFDDADPTQIRLLEDGSLDPNCAVGIWKEFAERHPDFPVKGCFYVMPDTMWGQRAQIGRKIQILKELGSEIGSHTVRHLQLKKLSDAEVKRELAGAIDYLRKQGIEGELALALPFGISPKNPELIRSFDLDGKRYGHSAALLVGANPAPSPRSPKFDRYRIPRIQAVEGDNGITYWLDQVEKGRVRPYVR